MYKSNSEKEINIENMSRMNWSRFVCIDDEYINIILQILLHICTYRRVSIAKRKMKQKKKKEKKESALKSVSWPYLVSLVPFYTFGRTLARVCV